MTTIEHLLTCLGEEAAEIAQMTSKMNRFGVNEVYTGSQNPELLPNSQRLVEELNDFMTLIDFLIAHGVIPREWQDRRLMAAKKEKVLKYMEYARRQGTLQPDNTAAGE